MCCGGDVVGLGLWHVFLALWVHICLHTQISVFSTQSAQQSLRLVSMVLPPIKKLHMTHLMHPVQLGRRGVPFWHKIVPHITVLPRQNMACFGVLAGTQNDPLRSAGHATPPPSTHTHHTQPIPGYSPP